MCTPQIYRRFTGRSSGPGAAKFAEYFSPANVIARHTKDGKTPAIPATPILAIDKPLGA